MVTLFTDPTRPTRGGYRLQRLEVLNWGTFNRQIWEITPKGANALLTGDIGSGKSTLVDAVTTLLVPHQKITFNKAAGAQTRERNLKTYILGAYKNEKVAQTGKARDVYLRAGDQHHTVLLAVFYNDALKHHISLAQVFWMQNENVKKFYVLAEHRLTIKKDFTNFGANILHLKKRLRQAEGQHVYNSFTEYSNRFRQLFGIRQPEALELFYQTVSMKSVGNLTDFVREQMLGQTNIQQNIDELVHRYHELTEAHHAVQVAKEQRELLTPLVKDTNRREGILKKIAALEEVVEEIPRYFAHLQLGAWQRHIRQSFTAWQENEAEHQRGQTRLTQQREDLKAQQIALAGLGVHQRINEIRLQLNPLRSERDRRQQQTARYLNYARQLTEAGIDFPDSVPLQPQEFLHRRQQLSDVQATVDSSLEALNRERPALYVRRDQQQQEAQQLKQELTSLRQRPTLIPARNLKLRARLLDRLQLPAEELPFVGELLQVRDTEQDWEGAIERQLHSFGLSLLVPDRHYQVVSALVDREQLGGKLVYLRTLDHRKRPSGTPASNSLVHKVRIKGDTEFYDWLQDELQLRHDYQCCDSLEEFRRVIRGLTRQGQSKSGRIQHTKDDRYAVNDRRRYILGWSNKAKIKALEQDLDTAQMTLQEVEAELHELRQREKVQEAQRHSISELLRFTTFTELDVSQQVSRIQELEEELRRLEEDSDELQQIQERIRALEVQIMRSEQQQQARNKRSGALRNELLRAAQQAFDLLPLLELDAPQLDVQPNEMSVNIAELVTAYLNLKLPAFAVSAVLQKRLTRETLPADGDAKAFIQLQQRLLSSIQGSRGAIRRQRDELARIEREIVQAMQRFRNRYPDEAREVDADPAAIPEFRVLHERLVQDDIPRHEERFRELLKQGAIRGILSFKTKLEDYEREVLAKIDSINRHLREIDYSEGTYITITAESVRTDDILTFKQQLRACLDNIYGEQNNIYTEEKFFQVKALLDRFQGTTEEDARWTRRVTDVRQWYVFGADERWREDDRSKEYYTDSSGKSGGQKEKLAYTILASAIAFQFGLEWGRSRERSFRFVVIDEAFGRGSDESTRYGLQLFERLDLQLLIVTPLQKINVIEDYIETVHFVSNPQGKNSVVRNITKAVYEEEKAAHLKKQAQ